MSAASHPERPVAVIVGAPGAGKSTVGRAVAERLGVGFVDTDAIIEERAGKSIADIFIQDGEDAFRALEEEAVGEALATQAGVVALGGGAVLRDATRARLASQRVVWLQVGVADAATRVGLNTARPLLLGNVRGTLMALLDARTPLYEEVAAVTVMTNGRSIDEVVAEVVAAVAA